MSDNPSRNFVYAFPSVHGTCYVINYSGSSEVNSFLSHFDAWGVGQGQDKLCKDRNHHSRWYECTREFYSLLHTDTLKRAFKHMKVELTFDWEDVKDIA